MTHGSGAPSHQSKQLAMAFATSLTRAGGVECNEMAAMSGWSDFQVKELIAYLLRSGVSIELGKMANGDLRYHILDQSTSTLDRVETLALIRRYCDRWSFETTAAKSERIAGDD